MTYTDSVAYWYIHACEVRGTRMKEKFSCSHHEYKQTRAQPTHIVFLLPASFLNPPWSPALGSCVGLVLLGGGGGGRRGGAAPVAGREGRGTPVLRAGAAR